MAWGFKSPSSHQSFPLYFRRLRFRLVQGHGQVTVLACQHGRLAEGSMAFDILAVAAKDNLGRVTAVFGDLFRVLAVGELHGNEGVTGVVKVSMANVERTQGALELPLAELFVVDRLASVVQQNIVIGLNAKRPDELYLVQD